MIFQVSSVVVQFYEKTKTASLRDTVSNPFPTTALSASGSRGLSRQFTGYSQALQPPPGYVFSIVQIPGKVKSKAIVLLCTAWLAFFEYVYLMCEASCTEAVINIHDGNTRYTRIKHGKESG